MLPLKNEMKTDTKTALSLRCKCSIKLCCRVETDEQQFTVVSLLSYYVEILRCVFMFDDKLKDFCVPDGHHLCLH